MKITSGRDDSRVALWERHPDHPGGEIFVAGDRVVEAAQTAAVERALTDGRLRLVAEQVYNYQGKRYSADTLHQAPRAFLLLLQERGQLPEGIAVPAPRLEDVDGVGPDLADGLRANGIESVAALAAADEQALRAVDGIGPKTAPKLRAAARALAA